MSAPNDGYICPFNRSHHILKKRFTTHVARCPDRLNHSDLEQCPFHVSHYIKKDKMKEHIEICEYRSKVDDFRYQVGAVAKKIDDLVFKESIDCDEDWDTNHTSYLEVKDKIISEKPVVLLGETGIGASQRRQIRIEQRERLAGIKCNEQKEREEMISVGSDTSRTDRSDTSHRPSSSRGAGRGISIQKY